LNSETELEYLDRVAWEYEIYNETVTAEKKLKNMIKLSENDSEIWLKYSNFLLRQK